VPVFPGIRDSSLFALPRKCWLGVLAAALCLIGIASAQDPSAAPVTPAASATTQSTTAAPTTQAPSPVQTDESSATPASPDQSAIKPDAPTGTIPTASQVEAAGAKDAAANPDLKQPPPGSTAAHGVNANQPGLAPKYNVGLIGQRNVGAGLDFYSLDREVALGRSLAAEVEGSSRLVTDPVVNEYVNRIGQNLVRNSDARVPFTIKVLDNEEVNAFALPGGFFYVDSGLILAADNEAELAGVMAHEIAHVAARHATKNMTRAQIWNFASVPLIFVGGPVAYAVAEAAGLLVPLGFLKFSRDAEREADLLGLEYDYASGYDPEAFVEFFEKLNIEKKKPNMVAKAFATHPMNVDRIEAAQDEIRKYLPDRPEYVLDTSEFQSVKARMEMLENGRRLGGVKAQPGRPVLLKRTSTSGANTGGDSGSSGDPADSSRPTLKRSPSSASDSPGDSSTTGNSTTANSGAGDSTQAASGTAQPQDQAQQNPSDDGRPTLKRNPTPASD
jgi:beta-barrel assembly-enhancing protease